MRIPRQASKFFLVLISPFFLFAFAQAQGIKSSLDLLEIEREMIMERQLMDSQPSSLNALPSAALKKLSGSVAQEDSMLLATIYLNNAFADIPQPIEIEKGNYIRVIGNGIKRFLVTEPRIVSVEKQGFDELSITGKEIGYTYVHIWDNQGRWSMGVYTIPPKPKGMNVAEEMRLTEEQARDFKMRYLMDWSSFEKGRRLDGLHRQTYSFFHSLTLEGPTPYGDIDSSLTFRTLKGQTELAYGTLGIENGVIGNYKGFSLRTFDFHPGISNLAYYDVYERGVVFKSPAFDNKIDYTVFWGREQPSMLTPSLAPGSTKKSLNSFLSGFDLKVKPKEKQVYNFSVFHGNGRDRQKQNLHTYGYDARAEYGLGPWLLGHETAYDSKKFAHLLTAFYKVPTFTLTSEIRDSSKDFLSMTGTGYRAGERGMLSTFSYNPEPELRTWAQLDVYQDRRFPNSIHGDYWNQDLRWNGAYTPDMNTSFSLDYTLQNDLGKIGAYRYQNGGGGLSHSFDFIKRITAFTRFSHQKNENFSVSSLDYVNDKGTGGVRVNLAPGLYYYLNGEYNWLKELATNNRTNPYAYETGLDWSERLLKSPLYLELLFTYRNEENTSSPLSFLSGQDYIEGYSELTWRQAPGKEVYCSTRVRNVWAEKEGAAKGVEADFRAGVRYLWDTGFHWDPVGIVYGYVFRDINEDGLMQRDEAPVEGVMIKLGRDQSEVTDIFGYYTFPRVKGRKMQARIDVSSLPPGFVLTGPAQQEALVTQGSAARVDFGIISRSEITGTVFEDANANGQLDPGEKGIKGVQINLENGSKILTDNFGRYSFRKAAVGKHAITMDLKSLPTTYIPLVPISKEIELFEGVSYVYNIPLKKIRQ